MDGDRVLLEAVVKRLVTTPDDVTVRSRHDYDTGTTFFLVSAAPHDTGKIIGKQGRTAEALRLVFMAIAALERRRVYIDINDPTK